MSPLRIFPRLLLVWLAAIVVISGIVGCGMKIPLAGMPCDVDADCDVPGEEPHFCATGFRRACVPGMPLVGRENLPPILQAAVIVTAQGVESRGSFTAMDPDSDGPLRFSVVGASPMNGTVTMDASGGYTFRPVDQASPRSSFMLSVTDAEGAMTTSVVMTIVIRTNENGLLTWMGQESSDFMLPDNWSPSIAPSTETSVFVPQTGGFDPRLSGMASTSSLYIGPEVDFELDNLAVYGSEIFSASALGHGNLTVTRSASVAGTIPGLAVDGEVLIETALDVNADLHLRAGAKMCLETKSVLTVRGSLVQASGGDLIRQDGDPIDGTVGLIIDGDLVLRGLGMNLPDGTLFLRGNLESSAGIGLARVVLRGKTKQTISTATGVHLPSVTTAVASDIRFIRSTTIGGDFDVKGRLSVQPEKTVVVDGTLILRTEFREGEAPGGTVVARDCVVANSVVVPSWVQCGIDVDAGSPPSFDAGSFDAGTVWPDAGVQTLPLDGGVDAGGESSSKDAGSDAGADGGSDAGNDGGPSLSSDAGLDDGGILLDGGFTQDDDDGGFLGPPQGSQIIPPVCPEPSAGLVRNGLMVLEAGNAAMLSLVAGDGSGAAPSVAFSAAYEIDFGTASTSSVGSSGAWTVVTDAEEAPGYYAIPVFVDVGNGPQGDCLSVRVVGRDEGRRPTPSGVWPWTWTYGWGGDDVPTENEVVFVPRDSLVSKTVAVASQVRSLLVETGANIDLRWSVDSPAVRELAVGDGNSVRETQVLRPDSSLVVAMSERLAEIDCANDEASISLAANLDVNAAVFANCTLVPSGWTLVSTGEASFQSTTRAALTMDHPSSRIIATSFQYVNDSDAPPLSAGETVVFGAISYTSTTEVTTATSGTHRTILKGLTTPVELATGMDVGAITVDAAQARITLTSTPALSNLVLNGGTLCVESADGGAVASASLEATPGSEYAVGPPWAAPACAGPSAWCQQMATGAANGTCPFED